MKHFRMLAAGLCSAVLLCGFADVYKRQFSVRAYTAAAGVLPSRQPGWCASIQADRLLCGASRPDSHDQT